MTTKPKENPCIAFVEQKLAVFLTMAGIPGVLLWDSLIVTPYYYKEVCSSLALHYIVLAILVTEFTTNLYCTRSKHAARYLPTNRAAAAAEGHHCNYCNKQFPQQFYHCRHCSTCVYKRDHHCFILGVCIGQWNQRYFIVALIYWLTGAIYMFTYFWQFFLDTIGESWITLVYVMIPHIAWLLGLDSFHTFITVLVQFLISFCIIAVTVVLVLQMRCISKGQTQFEQKHKIRGNSENSLRQNVVDVFGRRWYLILFSPFVSSPLPCERKFFLAQNETAEKVA